MGNVNFRKFNFIAYNIIIYYAIKINIYAIEIKKFH